MSVNILCSLSLAISLISALWRHGGSSTYLHPKSCFYLIYIEYTNNNTSLNIKIGLKNIGNDEYLLSCDRPSDVDYVVVDEKNMSYHA